MKDKGLGRGLLSLLGEEIVSSEKEEIVQIVNIDNVTPNESQPRKIFDYDKIRELADSILNHGLLQPIIVSNEYQIIAGERRWRACKLAKLSMIPVIVKHVDKKEVMEIALIENIQRAELSVIEEAEGLQYLVDNFLYTTEMLAEKLGKSRVHVANLLRLNKLPQSIKDKVNEGLLSMGHARCLINHEHAQVIADHIIENGLSVRQTEEIVKQWSRQDFTKDTNKTKHVKKKVPRIEQGNQDLAQIMKVLSEKFNIKVTIENYSSGGKLIFHYKDLEELDSILFKLN